MRNSIDRLQIEEMCEDYTRPGFQTVNLDWSGTVVKRCLKDVTVFRGLVTVLRKLKNEFELEHIKLSYMDTWRIEC